MISINKKYKTRDGRDVVIHEIKENVHLSPTVAFPKGEIIHPTYPVKGSIINPGKKRNEYNIWSIDGKMDVVWGNNSHKDLIETE